MIVARTNLLSVHSTALLALLLSSLWQVNPVPWFLGFTSTDPVTLVI